jgi:hypothetical protein
MYSSNEFLFMILQSDSDRQLSTILAFLKLQCNIIHLRSLVFFALYFWLVYFDSSKHPYIVIVA